MRRISQIVSSLMSLGVLLHAVPSYADGAAGAAKDLGSKVNRVSVIGRSRVAAPFAHVLYCVREPEDCRISEAASREELSKNAIADLELVNRRVNASIRPQNDDPNTMGGDVWSLEPKAGDCEDYAVSKRHELLAMGWSSQSLRLAQVLTPSGEGHLVLVASTDKGDVVLDNLRSQILPWRKTAFQWRLIQSSADPKIWLSI